MEGCEANFAVEVDIDVPDVGCEDFDVDNEDQIEEGSYDEGLSGAPVDDEGGEEEGGPKHSRPKKVRCRRAKHPKVKNCLRCSLFSVNCCNVLGLGFMALLCSLQVNKRLRKGDIKGARRCAGHACRTNVAAVLVSLSVVIVIGIVSGMCDINACLNSIACILNKRK